MSVTFVRIKQNVALLGLVIALVVTGATPLLGGHEAEAKERASTRLVQQFENTEQRIGFIDGAGPMVSNIEVSGFETPVADVDVTLFGISHGPNSSLDMDVLLVGPDGQATLLLSDIGGNATTNVSQLVLDDQAAHPLPANSALSSGTFQPNNIDAPDPIPGAPTPPSAASLAVFNGSDPNGTWSLWAYDDETNGVPQTGSGINGGWALKITGANGVPDANPDDFQTKDGKTLKVPATGVLANDSDPDGDALTAILARKPQKGKVELEADGSFTYKAKGKAKGKDSFTYLARDPGGLSSTATVDIQIKAKKDKKKGKGGKKGKK